MEQSTGSKLGEEYIKVVYCHTAYFPYMQSTSCEMPGWMTHKLESRLPGEISTTSNMQKLYLRYDTTLMVESEEELKSLLMRVKEENETAGLTFNTIKTKIITSCTIM